MTWSKLAKTPIGLLAKSLHQNPDRTYHNWNHLEHGWQHAEQTVNLSYDINVDMAWLFHDCIWDKFPDKEIRSANKFLEIFSDNPVSGVNPDKVVELINTTISHDVFRKDQRLALLDLVDYTNPSQYIPNIALLSEEAFRVNGTSLNDFTASSKKLLISLNKTVICNCATGKHQSIWMSISDGITDMIDIISKNN